MKGIFYQSEATFGNLQNFITLETIMHVHTTLSGNGNWRQAICMYLSTLSTWPDLVSDISGFTAH